MSLSWYFYLLILFLPILVNVAVGIYIQLVLKQINRQEKNPPWTYKKSLISAIVIGAPMGALTQVLLQEALSPYVYLTEEISPWLIMIGYKSILWWAKKTKHELLYEYFRVRHAPIEYPDQDSDFTIQHYRQNHDIREE